MFPAPSTREMFELAAGQTSTFESPMGIESTIQDWSDRAAVVLGRAHAELYVSTVKAGTSSSVAAEIVTDGDDNLCVRWVTALKAAPEERVVRQEQLKDVLGKSRHDEEEDRKAHRERERAEKQLKDAAAEGARGR